MATFAARTKVLIFGNDYQIFHCYWRADIQSPEREIVGFIYSTPCEKPPITQFRGVSKTPLQVYPLSELEDAIHKLRVKKCLLLLQNHGMNDVQSVINRIIAVGSCDIEFIPPMSLGIRAFKPIIVVSSLAPALGKTQVTRYICNILSVKKRKVSVIIPLTEIIPIDETLVVEDGPHFEFKEGDIIPPNTLSDEDSWQIQQLLKSGAYRVFATSDVRRAIICAEQYADVILFDSKNCESPAIMTQNKFCLVNLDSLDQIRKYSLWPGLLNLLTSENVIVVNRDKRTISEENKHYITKLIGESHKLFYVQSEFVLDDSSGFEIFNRPVLAIDHVDMQGVSQAVARTCGASELIDPSPFLTEGLETVEKSIVTKIPRSTSPIVSDQNQTIKEMAGLAKAINTSNADVVIVSLQRDIEGILPGKQILYTSPEITDTDSSLYNWLERFFTNKAKPPLQEHFAAQVDILMAMATASDRELYVTNNDSANREAFCRLFLQSHLPPSFRVTTGEIIDASGNITGQLDVVIVNDNSPRLTIDATGSIIAPILADAVLSVIEVKTSLTTDSLKKALSQMRPVKALMPTHATLLTPNGNVIEDPLEGKIITGIFSFNPVGDIEDKVQEIITLYPGVVDFVVLPSSFGFFSVDILRVCGMDPRETDIVNGYVKYTARGMGLAMLYGILNYLAATRRFSGSNCIRYLGGSWGGIDESTARYQSNAEHQLHKLGQIIVKDGTVDQKKTFFKHTKHIMSAISEVRSSIIKKQSAVLSEIKAPPSEQST